MPFNLGRTVFLIVAVVQLACLAACGGSGGYGGGGGNTPVTGVGPSKVFAADSGHMAIGSLANPDPGAGAIAIDRIIGPQPGAIVVPLSREAGHQGVVDRVLVVPVVGGAGLLPVESLHSRNLGLDGLNEAFDVLARGDAVRQVVRY